MSNTPPIPDAMTPPWPAQPGPIDLPHAEETVAEVKAKGKSKAKKVVDAPAAKTDVRKIAGLGAAIGIGSAAIVAALLYVNRPGKK
jgi:hypothetical protein